MRNRVLRDLDDDPIISKSGVGSSLLRRRADMKVPEQVAVRYFNKAGNPEWICRPTSSAIRSRLSTTGKRTPENAYKGNVIIRALSYGGGIYEGKVTLSYNDDYNDGRGQGGSGCVLTGMQGCPHRNGFSSYQAVTWANRSPTHTAYRNVQTTRGSVPIPKGGKVPEEKPASRDSRPSTITVRRSLRNPSLSSSEAHPKPSVADIIYGSMHHFCVLLEMLETGHGATIRALRRQEDPPHERRHGEDVRRSR